MDIATLDTIRGRNSTFEEWVADGKHWMDFSDPEAAADRQILLRYVTDLERHHADDRNTETLVNAVCAYFEASEPVFVGGSLGPEQYDASERLVAALSLFGIKADLDTGKIER